MKTSKPEDLIAVRVTSHGEFSDQASMIHRTLTVWESYKNWKTLTPVQREGLHMFLRKIGRILVGDPDFKDHWDDIGGYAKLVSDRCAAPKEIHPAVKSFLWPEEPNRPGTPEDGGHAAKATE